MSVILLRNQSISCLEPNPERDFAMTYEEHVSCIAALEMDTFSHAWDLKSCQESLNCDYNVGFTLWDKDGFSGYLMASIVQDETELLRIAVVKAKRGMGYGNRLLRAYFDYVKNVCLMGMLEVRSGNISAKTLYENAGYEKIGTRKKYYGDPVEDGDIYQIQFEKLNDNL